MFNMSKKIIVDVLLWFTCRTTEQIFFLQFIVPTPKKSLSSPFLLGQLSDHNNNTILYSYKWTITLYMISVYILMSMKKKNDMIFKSQDKNKFQFNYINYLGTIISSLLLVCEIDLLRVLSWCLNYITGN